MCRAWEVETHCCYYLRSAAGVLQSNRSVSFQHQRQSCACRAGVAGDCAGRVRTEAVAGQRPSPSAGPELLVKVSRIGPGPELMTFTMHVCGQKHTLAFLLPPSVGPVLPVEGFKFQPNLDGLMRSIYAWGQRHTLGSAFAAQGMPGDRRHTLGVIVATVGGARAARGGARPARAAGAAAAGACTGQVEANLAKMADV